MKEIKKEKMIAGIVIGAIIVAGVSFYAGTEYGSGSNTKLAASQGGQNRFQQAGGTGIRNATGARNFGNAAQGEVLSKDDKSITIKLSDGGSRIVLLSSQTPIMKSSSGSLGDITVGEQVIASGTNNSDGSLTASSVQIRPNIKK